MRTTVLLVIVLLTLGLWSAPAMAGDHAVIQQLPASCQPVSDVELSQLSGKQGFSFNWCQVARCIYSQLPPPTQQKILCAVQVARMINSCINGKNTDGVMPLTQVK
jgi:hypothetical protein